MKPVRLEVRGFTAFRDPATVEFEGRRLFVITGPTGAGKSSLLDAITWALYGQAPRVGRSVKELLSQGEREMSVLFEFTVRGRGYRVARRHPGTTSTRLERLVEGQWVPVADRATEVTREVTALLGMDYATFTRAIILPQGEFDSFLRGEAKDRRAILSQLIGLGVYQRAGELARARAGRHRTQADSIRTQLEQLAFATPEVLADRRDREAALAGEEAALRTQREALSALADLARSDRERWQEAERATVDVREAEAETEQARGEAERTSRAVEEHTRAVERITADLHALGYDVRQHDRLKSAVAILDQRVDAEAAVEQARRDLEQSREAARLAGQAAIDAGRRAQEAEAALQAAAETERESTAALSRAAGRASLLRERMEADAATAEEESAKAEGEARELEARGRELESLRQAWSSADTDLARAEDAVRRAQQEHDQREKQLEQSKTDRLAAEREARAARTDLEQARMENAAAHLRAGLEVGDPCPVCGETITTLDEHEAPDLERAVEACNRADSRLDGARIVAEQASSALAAAVARLEEAGRAREVAHAHREALSRQAEELGTKPADLASAVERARTEALARSEASRAGRDESRRLRESAQTLRERLARLPEGIEPLEAKRLPADRSRVPAELDDALAAHTTAVGALREAERATSLAAEEARAAERDAEVARRDIARAEQTMTRAEGRLANLGGVEGDPGAIRAALARIDDQAERHAALSGSLSSEREALASAEASRQAAAAALTRSQDQLRRRQEACGQARQAASRARTAFTSAWRETIGETEPSTRELKRVMDEHEAERIRVAKDIERVRGEIEQAAQQIEQAERMRREVAEHQAQADLVGSVGTDLQGNRFIAFLLRESMQLLADDASERLNQFTNGRYALVAEEDAFMVMDHLNGDELRSVKTLSGGETFLASLALALALSEHLPEISGTGGAVSLDSLFLDEGFGALDAEALDLAVQGLETLAEGSRMIGVISHVEELSERLPDRIRVEKGAHSSVVVT